MKKELTQEQFEELKNLIAPENKEKFNKNIFFILILIKRFYNI